MLLGFVRLFVHYSQQNGRIMRWFSLVVPSFRVNLYFVNLDIVKF